MRLGDQYAEIPCRLRGALRGPHGEGFVVHRGLKLGMVHGREAYMRTSYRRIAYKTTLRYQMRITLVHNKY